MKDVCFDFFGEGTKIGRRILKIVLAFLHPVQTKSGWMVGKSMQPIHPRSLFRKRYLAEADQCDAQTTCDQSRHQFPCVGPVAVQRVGCDENVHTTSYQPSALTRDSNAS